MKKLLCLSFLALMLGCGEGPPAELTPEKKAEMDAKMKDDMTKMMGSMNQSPLPPGVKKPK